MAYGLASGSPNLATDRFLEQPPPKSSHFHPVGCANLFNGLETDLFC